MNYSMQVMVDQETMNWLNDLNRSGFNIYFMHCFEASTYIDKHIINEIKLGDFVQTGSNRPRLQEIYHKRMQPT